MSDTEETLTSEQKNQQGLTWKQCTVDGNSPSGLHGHTAIVYDDCMYIFAGMIGGKASSDVYEFDLETHEWEKMNTTGIKPPPRYNHSAVLTAQGTMIVFGGQFSMVKRNDLLELDLASMKWTDHTKRCKGKAPEKRHSHTAVLGEDGDWMLIFGGISNKHENDVHLLDLNTFTWKKITPTGDIPSARYGHRAITHNGEMFVFGGQDGRSEGKGNNKAGYVNTLYALDLESFKWRFIDLTPETPVIINQVDDDDDEEEPEYETLTHRNYHSLVVKGDSLYVYGGFNGENPLDDLVQINLNTNKWKKLTLSDGPAKLMNQSGILHKSAMYIFGGQDEKFNNRDEVFKLQFEKGEEEEKPKKKVVKEEVKQEEKKEKPKKKTSLDMEKLEQPDIDYIVTQLVNNNPDLVKLNLRNKNITAQDVRKIMPALEYNTKLKKLDLSKNGFSETCVSAIKKMLSKNNSIETLLLDGNDIGPSGINTLIFALEQNKSLTDMTISEKCTDEDFEIIDRYLDRNYDAKGGQVTKFSDEEDEEEPEEEEEEEAPAKKDNVSSMMSGLSLAEQILLERQREEEERSERANRAALAYKEKMEKERKKREALEEKKRLEQQRRMELEQQKKLERARQKEEEARLAEEKLKRSKQLAKEQYEARAVHKRRKTENKQQKFDLEKMTEIQKQFAEYSMQLEQHHDKMERIYKSSRDVTIESKRCIFTLHRITPENKEQILKSARSSLDKIRGFIKQICSEVYQNNMEFWLYQWKFSFGIQEFVESLSFYHFLKEKKLITKEEIEKELIFEIDDKQVQWFITETDYLLGIGDLTGELMRLATNAVTISDRDTPFEIMDFLQQLYALFQSLPPRIHKDMEFKIKVMRDNCKKVEQICYAIVLSKAEIE